MGYKRLARLQKGAVGLAIASSLTLGAALFMPTPTAAQAPPVGLTAYNFTAVDPLKDYFLGAGDVLFIEVVNLPSTVTRQKTFTVNLDGSIALPLAGRVIVGGLTLPQAEQVILNAYSKVIRFPAVTVSLQAPRPIKILVAGEVKRPGNYILSTSSGGGLSWPRLSQVLAQSGGITQEADIRNIEVRRQLGNGQTAVTKINLWEMIQSGDANQDITLRSDDVIVVPKAKEVNAAEAIRVASATFSPEKIQIQVLGEVLRPGIVEVPANATLTQGIGAAGGFNVQRANRSRVTLVRLNRDGTVSRRRIPFSLAAQPDANNNPVLQEGDVILVERSGVTQVGDAIGNALRPLGGLGTLGIIFNLINQFD